MVKPPAVKRERLDRPSSDGQFTTPSFLRERVGGFSGFCVAPTHTVLETMADRLRNLITQQITVTLEYPGVRMHGQGVVTDVQFTPHGFAPEGTWMVEVEFDDPFLYGETRTFPAGVEAIQRGTRPAWPVHTVTGASFWGYTITGPSGRRIAVTRPLVALHPHTINTATGGLLIDGVRVQGGVTVWEPWTIGPSIPGVTHTLSAETTASLTTAVTDTYA
ncbi:hypothetical protein J2Y69_002139 [Microbacterium resistens]|uniref:Uncharacterized protein n=1 Tax=Microbacterium resistens TaxID=156977 RepID=A0ABU1SD45_9MICO|nr:hypothetical protein [Microbacterium resistens]MDR6867535.1 hypothetical protein [Microbacterium resistens]